MRQLLLSTALASAALFAATPGMAVEPSLEVFLRGLAPQNMAESLRVVGGTATTAEKWPWQVYLTVPHGGGNFGLCGGSLIAPRWVLTAAHCLNDWVKNSPITVVEGMRSIDPDDFMKRDAIKEYRTTRVFMDKYDDKVRTNDIALIQLPEAAGSTPVPLQLVADPSLEAAGKVTTVTGWGVLHPIKQQPNGTVVDADTGQKLNNSQFRTGKLMQVQLPLVDLKTCEQIYKSGDGSVDGRNLCAGYKEGGKDSCQGDSGGPMVVSLGNNQFRQIGVVSWGAGCASPGIPGIYTRVSAFSDWIKATLGKDLVIAEGDTPGPVANAPPPPPAVNPPPKPVAVNPPQPVGGPPAHGAAAPAQAPAPASAPVPEPMPAPAPVQTAAAPAKPAVPEPVHTNAPGRVQPPATPDGTPDNASDPIDNNPGGIAIELDSGDDVKIGAKVAFRVTAKKPGYVTLIDKGPDDTMTVIYPNEFSLRTPGGGKASGQIVPGQTLTVPDKRNPYAGFEYVIDPPAGEGMLVAILSDAPLTADDLKGGPKAFKSRADSRAFIMRIAGKLRGSIKSRADGSPEKPDYSITFHPYTISP